MNMSRVDEYKDLRQYVLECTWQDRVQQIGFPYDPLHSGYRYRRGRWAVSIIDTTPVNLGLREPHNVPFYIHYGKKGIALFNVDSASIVTMARACIKFVRTAKHDSPAFAGSRAQSVPPALRRIYWAEAGQPGAFTPKL
jgi:hypothetical protein